MKKILLIEDDSKSRSNIKYLLEANNYKVFSAEDGLDGINMAIEIKPDLVICDILMPLVDGYKVKEELSANTKTSSIPFIFLSGKSDLSDIRRGMNLGADDYLTKPFAIEELLARARALLRRAGGAPTGILQVDDVILNPVTREVTRGGQRLEFTTKEYALLEYLMRNAGRVLTRSMITEHVWDLDFDTFTNVIDVYISYLRNKIDKGRERGLIQTVRGSGYMMRSDG